MLREEVEQYTNLTGKDGWHVPIMKVGAYLDGYNKGLEVLDKIYADIQKLRNCSCSCSDGIIDDVEDIIDKYKAESEGPPPAPERDCEHCVHRKDKGCEKWNCEFERRQ